ncbi:MAG: hypothetical protein Kow00117_20880 [Phototrophicales bacterium]|nr:MAG: hypothetical protein CUN56_09795 [Phototrophicales bacterium]RMG74589.1 MAG: sortase [Chloroflexota bacterium]
MISRRKRNPLSNLFVLIIFGAIAGIGFLIYDSFLRGSDEPEPSLPVVNNNTPVPTTAISVASTPTFSTPSTPSTPTATPIASNYRPITDAHLIIPSVAINTPVINVYLNGTSWDVSNLGVNVGHLQGTTWIGGVPGNIVLSGHVELADGRQGVFANIENLQIGDRIILREGNVEYRYAVVDIYNTDPTNLDPVRPTLEERLTLITCDSYDFFRDTYLERTIVVAERIG